MLEKGNEDQIRYESDFDKLEKTVMNLLNTSKL